eukprot:TRINITY_DN18001_c0_g1_i1.p1 TRINITY_DN18001_c0_g1~~TRINITY_DN18001_c0_g1_i1.p1  ORF type:complete len:174 (-),score=48.79 TRINITY_DN18001_c0_g1_i1:34-528(-)
MVLLLKGLARLPAALSMVAAPRRLVQTQVISADDRQKLQKDQKAKRPLSPHLTIYKWGPGMISSILHRGTGVGMTTLVIGSSLFAVASGQPVPELIHAAHDIPLFVPLAKLAVTVPLTYHTMHGIRHLVWDKGNKIDNMQEIDKSSYAIWGTTLALSSIISFLF